MARGANAKIEVLNTIAKAFGDKFIGEYDKKIYVWANDGGEQVQIAISLTCPKNPIEIAANVDTDGGDWDFSDDVSTNIKVAVANAAPAEITDEEKENITNLLVKLGL